MGTTTINIRPPLINALARVGKGWAAWVMVVALSGCTVIPGLDLSVNETREGAPNQIGGFELVEITPEVVVDVASREVPIYGMGDLRPASELDQRPTSGWPEYRIGVGDVLTIVVWDHPELTNPTGEFRDPESAGRLVDSDGEVFFPYVGELSVAGLTVSEVRKILAKQLAEVIRDPQVDVRVAAFRSQRVRITGEVAEPRVMPITDRTLTVSEAIASAGGLRPSANRRTAILSRGAADYRIDLRSVLGEGIRHGDLVLRDGDVLHVPNNDAQSVFLLGSVNEQGVLPMPRGTMSLAEALAGVSGLDRTQADRERVFVVRAASRSTAEGSNDTSEGLRPVIYQLKLSSVSALLLGEQFPLWPRDVVYVDRTGLATYNTIVSQILPSVSTLFQLDRLLLDDN